MVCLSMELVYLLEPPMETEQEAAVGGEASEEGEDELEDNQDSKDEDMASFHTMEAVEDGWDT